MTGTLLDSRCYCFECVDTLVGPRTSGKVQAMSNWVCFLCLPFPRSGLLHRRRKWRGWLKAFCDRESVRGGGQVGGAAAAGEGGWAPRTDEPCAGALTLSFLCYQWQKAPLL